MLKCISYKKRVLIHTREFRVQQKRPPVKFESKHLQDIALHYFRNTNNKGVKYMK